MCCFPAIPAVVEKVAELFDNPKFIAYNRELKTVIPGRTIVSKKEGKEEEKFSVCFNSRYGLPLAAIAVEE